MKAGVSTSPCGVVRSPQRARPSRARIEKEKPAIAAGSIAKERFWRRLAGA
jgi:hypothetical protein